MNTDLRILRGPDSHRCSKLVKNVFLSKIGAASADLRSAIAHFPRTSAASPMPKDSRVPWPGIGFGLALGLAASRCTRPTNVSNYFVFSPFSPCSQLCGDSVRVSYVSSGNKGSKQSSNLSSPPDTGQADAADAIAYIVSQHYREHKARLGAKEASGRLENTTSMSRVGHTRCLCPCCP